MSADFDDSADFHNDSDKSRRAAAQWPGFDPAEALHWSKVLLHHSPDPQRAAVKAQMSSAIKRGIPIAGPGWVSTADAARSDGFTPALYQTLFDTLQSIPRTAFRSHPGHRQNRHCTYLPGTPYESELWCDWPKLFLAEGFDAHAATTLTLLRAEPKFPRPRSNN